MASPNVIRFLSVGFMYTMAISTALAAQGDDPDWPCIQRKVPTLSLGQIWNGPELGPAVKGQEDAILVTELSARRVPLAEAQQMIADFAGSLADDQRKARMMTLVRELFDHMDRERSQVISGIARYAHRQRDMAERLRQEASEVDALRAQPDADPSQVALRNDRLVFQTRIFQERAQSLTFVCEVPTIIEQRLYALAKTISQAVGSQ